MMVIDELEKIKIKDFFDACNEMIKGKFILSDIKITRILKSIASSKILYDVFAKCLLGFNFERELKTAKVSNRVNGGYFVLPNDEKKIISLVFCLLLEVDNKKMNLQAFVNENFYSPEGYNFSYSNFAINILVPFKNSVLNALGCNENGETTTPDEEFEQEELDVDSAPKEDSKLLFANLRMAINQLYSACKISKKFKNDKKEELRIVLNGLHEAINLENFKIVNALIIPLEYIIGGQKEFRRLYENVKTCIIDFYNRMSE